MPRIHPDYNNDDFLARLIDRAGNRRRKDVGKDSEGRAFVNYRGQSDLCYAYSVKTGEYYIGYSSISGGMYGNQGFLGNQPQNLGKRDKIPDRELPERRLRRLEVQMGNTATSDPRGLNRPIANCAEACAYSIALAYDELLSDLFFSSFFPGAGQHARDDRGAPRPKPPCGNCKTWLKGAFGYWEDGFVFPEMK